MNTTRLIASAVAACALTMSAIAQDTKPGQGQGQGKGQGQGQGQGQGERQRDRERPAGQGTGQGAGQGPRQGNRPMMAPEQAKAAWEIQAKNVAASLSLTPEQTQAVTKAYVDLRQKHASELDKLRQEMMEQRAAAAAADDAGDADDADGDGDGAEDDSAEQSSPQRQIFEQMRRKHRELTQTNRAALETELAKSLNQEQVDKAMDSLGTFNANWDMMVHALAGFNLEQSKMDTAVNATREYIENIGKAIESGDPEAARAVNQDARRELTETIRPLLSEEQFGQFRRALAGAGMGGAGRGGTGGPGGRGPGQPGAPGAPGEAGGGESGQEGGSAPPERGGRGGRGGGNNPNRGGGAGGAGGAGGGNSQ